MSEFERDKSREKVAYLDPTNGFQEHTTYVEVREDGVTGVTSRILPHRFRTAGGQDVREHAEAGAATCPFCRERMEQVTPRFTADVIQEGRFRRGQAVLFPNAFPYGRNSSVAIFSHEHALRLSAMDVGILGDGFLVCRDYFQRLQQMDPALGFCSVNWNYMPPAGGGLVHPHLQTICGPRPTAFAAKTHESARGYQTRTGRNLWEDLVAHEKREMERYLGQTGPVEWVSSFAPKGMAGEVCFFLPARASIFTLTDEDVLQLALGLRCVFRYLEAAGIASFNLALDATLMDDAAFGVRGRLIPRFTLPPLGISDVNYYEKLQNEIICITVPEDMAREMRPFFERRR
ncbi:MAG: hypothetical protein GXX83_03730 [Gaiellales bacterium]|nr:hypothetical protein [Gaiellales bacterium]